MPHGTAAFVGRQAELAVLRGKLDSAIAAQGSMAALVGEAGIGKTSLAREFADYATSHGATVHWGSCFEGDWQPPDCASTATDESTVFPRRCSRRRA